MNIEDLQMKKLSLVTVYCLLVLTSFSQKVNWQNLDYREDSVYGISIEKAYRDILKDKHPDTIIVAVIDNGIDTAQEDLRHTLWRNSKEDGSEDNDKNGYRGDMHGWNFLGGRNGQNLYSVPYEFERQYLLLKDKYGNVSGAAIRKKNRNEYTLWLQVKERFQTDSIKSVTGFWSFYNKLLAADSTIRKVLGREEYVYGDLKDLDQSVIGKNNLMMELLQFERSKTNKEYLKGRQQGVKGILEPFTMSTIATLAKGRQDIIGDRYHDLNDRFYGNNIIGSGDYCLHGTHVSGIIAAERNNGKGMNGIANAVKIMGIRAVPYKGDEYDKDVALAIRYAVDNGAKVINISFAKAYSPERKWVEDAIRYAAKKDVLIVNAAGNDGRNIDSTPMYPTANYMKGNKKAGNMICVGASGPAKDNLVADFSNYGKNTVDVFAPGIDIYSTRPGGDEDLYMNLSGTSMAAPVVTGLAAVLRSYYPKLSARQIKYIIETSVIKISGPVTKPGRSKEQVQMSELCKTGGIVNAYQAIKMAEDMH